MVERKKVVSAYHPGCSLCWEHSPTAKEHRLFQWYGHGTSEIGVQRKISMHFQRSVSKGPAQSRARPGRLFGGDLFDSISGPASRSNKAICSLSKQVLERTIDSDFGGILQSRALADRGFLGEWCKSLLCFGKSRAAQNNISIRRYSALL